MEMKLDRHQSGGSLSNPEQSLTTYITLGNHIIFCAFVSSCLSCLSGMAGFNGIKVESDYLLICVCNIRVPRWSSQRSQLGPLGAAVI